MAKKWLGIDVKALLLKTLVGGAIFGFLSWIVNQLIASLMEAGLGWMQYGILILASVGLVFALQFRKGKENIFEALISAGFVYGVFGMIDFLFKVSILSAYNVIGLFEVLLFFTLFFMAEGVSQRVMKNLKFF